MPCRTGSTETNIMYNSSRPEGRGDEKPPERKFGCLSASSSARRSGGLGHGAEPHFRETACAEMPSRVAAVMMESAASLADLLTAHPFSDGEDLINTWIGPSRLAPRERKPPESGARLRSAGVEPGQAVVVQLPNGPEFVFAMFGVWLAGAVFVPANARQPQAELDHVLSSTAPACVIDSAGIDVSDRVAHFLRARYGICHLDVGNHRATEADPADAHWVPGTAGPCPRSAAGPAR